MLHRVLLTTGVFFGSWGEMYSSEPSFLDFDKRSEAPFQNTRSHDFKKKTEKGKKITEKRKNPVKQIIIYNELKTYKKVKKFLPEEQSRPLPILDWSVQLSFPKIDDDKPTGGDGPSSLLFEPTSQEFTLCSFSFDGTSAPVSKNLKNVKSFKDSNVGYILYNDQFPNGKDFITYGHAKGFFFWDQKNVWWVMHSVPEWPESLSPLPPISESQRKYGQSLCLIKSTIDSIDPIIHQLLVNTVNVYDSKVPDHQKTLPWMSFLFSKRKTSWNLRVGQFFVQDFIYAPTSKKETSIKMKHFAKGPRWGKDLYDNLISSTLKIKTFSETWGRPLMPASLLSRNILEIKWPHVDADYREGEDHSKWAISTDQESSWAFILDINRMKSQFKRGGGGMGVQSPTLWKALRNMIVKTD